MSDVKPPPPEPVREPASSAGDRLEPGSVAWTEAWRLYPQRITRHLTAEQQNDPELNPLHPFATSWPPGRHPRPAGVTEWSPALITALRKERQAQNKEQSV